MNKSILVSQRELALSLKYFRTYPFLVEDVMKHASFVGRKTAPASVLQYLHECQKLVDMIERKFGHSPDVVAKARSALAACDQVALEILVIEYVPVTREWMNSHMALVQKRTRLMGIHRMTELEEDELADVKDQIERNENEHPIHRYISMITEMLGRQDHLRQTIKSMAWEQTVKPVAEIMANELRELVGLKTKPLPA